MINVSNEFRQMLDNDKRSYKLKLDITLNDGTELTILNNKIWENGFSISDATSGNNRFDIGSVISNKLVANLKNTDKEFSQYDFYDSEIVAWVGLELSDGTIEYLRKGTYFVDDPLENESSMNLECLDYLAKFDRPYSDSTLLYPATLAQIVVDACSVCGVTIVSASFPNSDYVVKERPDDEAITFRDVIGYVAQIACCFAKADAYGRLFFGWYDTREVVAPRVLATSEGEAIATSASELLSVLVKATDDDYINNSVGTKLHRIVALSSQEVALSDTVITGIVVTENADSSEAAKSYMYGNEGYVLSVANNKLIQKGNGMDAAKRIGRRAVGLKFRKMNISCLSDPSMETGDRAYVIDRKKNVYVTYITSTDFKPGNYQKVECSAETPSKKKSPNYDMATKLRADSRENTKRQIGDYDLAVQSLTSLITQSLGIFKTEEVLEDNSVIYYMHNKPTLAESQTIWKMTADAFAVSTDGGETWNAGMDSEGNAVVNILSAIGIKANWIDAENLNAISAKIGGWSIGEQAIYKDIKDPSDENVIYRVYFQPPLQNAINKTWVLSCQKSTNGGSTFAGSFILYSDGSAKFGNTIISADGSAKFGNTTISADGKITTTTSDGTEITLDGDGLYMYDPDESSAVYVSPNAISTKQFSYTSINGFEPYTGYVNLAGSNGTNKSLRFVQGILVSVS